MSSPEVGLPEALERAASALRGDAEAIRPANGDPLRLAEELGAEGGARVLAWLLEHEPTAGAELAAAWVEHPDAGSQALLRIDRDALPKPGRKALRRVLHQLRSRGVALPEPERSALVATLPSIDDDVHEARLSPIDPQGARVAYLAESHPSGGVRLFELVIDDARGVLEFEVYSSGRSRVRRFLRDFEKRGRFAAVPAPPESARAAIARALEAHPADRPLPRAFSQWRSRVAEAPEGAEPPGALARAALAPEAPDAARLEAAVKLVEAGELGPWPPPEGLEDVVERLGEIARGVIVVSGARRQEQVRSILDDALDALWSGDFGARTAGRLDEMAWVFWKGQREEDARACLAAADAFRGGSPRENPVARAMLDSVLQPAIAAANEEEEKGGEDSDLLVKP